MMEYDSAFKRKLMLTQATTWVTVEDIMLREISLSPKDKYCMVPLVGSLEKSIYQERRWNKVTRR